MASSVTPASDISISSVRIINNHAEYAVERGNCRVWRRFRDFENLRKSLLLGAPSPKAVPDLPPKQTWWASRGENVTSQRKVLLEVFLRKVDENPALLAGDKRVTWEAFFDNKADPDSSGVSSSTYLDASGVLPSSTLPSETSESSSYIQDEEGLKRLEREVARIKSSMKKAHQDDLARFVRALEAEREGTRALRQKVQALERELRHLKMASNGVHEGKPQSGKGQSTADPDRLNPFEDAEEEVNDSSSLPSLESDVGAKDVKAEEKQQDSESLEGAKILTETEDEQKKQAESSPGGTVNSKTSAGVSSIPPAVPRTRPTTSKNDRPTDIVEVKDVVEDENENDDDDEEMSICSASSLNVSSSSMNKSSLGESILGIASGSSAPTTSSASKAETKPTLMEGAPLVHPPTPLKIATKKSAERRKPESVSPVRELYGEDSFMSAASTSSHSQRERVERALQSAKEEDLTRRISRLSLDFGMRSPDDVEKVIVSLAKAMALRGRASHKVAIFGCKSILNFANDLALCARLGELGVCESVCASMLTAFGEDEDELIAMEACGAICNLAYSDDNARRLIKARAFEGICKALRRWGQTNSAVAFSAFSAALNLFLDKTCLLRFASKGGDQLVAQVLHRWANEDAEIASEGCVLVRNLAEDLRLCERMGSEACESVVMALRRFGKDNYTVKLEGCLALRNLAMSASNRDRLGQCDACEVVVDVLKEMIAKDKVDEEQQKLMCLHGLLAVRNLSSKHVDNAARLGRAGACDVVIAIAEWVSLMATKDEELVCALCAAMWNLSFDDGNASEFLTANKHFTFRFLVDVMRWYGSSASSSQTLSLVACGAICRLLLANEPPSSVAGDAQREFKKLKLKEVLEKSATNESLRLALELLEQ